jgi:hypothetical protein
LLTTAVFLLPVYGSWVDVTYAGRQPGHKHIFLGKVNPYHHLNIDSDDVVNLPDQDATSQPVILIFLPGSQLVIFSHESLNLAFNLLDDCLYPEDAFLPPPDHPPRI